MNIPFVDLKAQYESIKPEIDSAIENTIKNTNFILGTAVAKFEKSFSSFCKSRHAIGVNSGTDALIITLKALGIGPGDEIITVPNTFIATTEAITLSGAKPVFVDVDEQTFNIDVDKIEKAITDKTKVILPVHLYGQMTDMERISELANKHNLKIIEDACQAHGAEDNGHPSGSLSDAACYSFFPGKNLGAYGDGGCVTTNSQDLDDRIRRLRNHGRVDKYEHIEEGFNSRLDALQAAILTVKLKYLQEWINKRRENAKEYNNLLKNVVIPFEDDGKKHAYHLYVIRTQNRQKLMEKLKETGVNCGIHYPLPLHLQPAYKYLNYKKGDFPITEKLSGEILSLPIYPEMIKEQIEYVCEIVNSRSDSL